MAIKIDEVELMKRLVQKDQVALATLLRMHGPKLNGWLRSRFGGVLQAAEIDEALSVTAFNAWRFANTFDAEKASLGAWLIAIAGNAARSIIRGESSHRKMRLEYDERYEPVWPDEVDACDSAGCDQRRLLDLEQAISQLPVLQKAVIEADLASNGDTDDKRLAAIKGTSKNSIQVSRHKALKSLLRLMSEAGYDLDGRKMSHET